MTTRLVAKAVVATLLGLSLAGHAQSAGHRVSSQIQVSFVIIASCAVSRTDVAPVVLCQAGMPAPVVKLEPGRDIGGRWVVEF